jgi:replicative DNA helicase
MQPSLLNDYPLTPEDFDGEEFHQIVFASIFNLYNQGVKVIDIFAIDEFISRYPKQYKIFNDNNGLEYLSDASGMCEINNFEYNYTRVKKYSLLRYYLSQGYDISQIYDTSVVEPAAQEEEQRKFDNYSIEDIIGIVELKMVIDPKMRFKSSIKSTGQLAGLGMLDLIESYQKSPEMGYPMQSKFMNSLLRGARKSTFYLRSGGTGSGKSRLSFADTCCACIPWIYDIVKGKWVHTGFSTPGLIISTELRVDEVQSIILSFVSGVEEGHIIDNAYEDGEYDRVVQAATYIESSPLYIEYLPNFDLNDVTDLIKKYYREKGVEIVNFDYLHTSIKMLIQISSLSKGMRIREDQVLFMASDSLKTCSTELNIHVDSATQLNGDYKDAKEKDQNILRGQLGPITPYP